MDFLPGEAELQMREKHAMSAADAPSPAASSPFGVVPSPSDSLLAPSSPGSFQFGFDGNSPSPATPPADAASSSSGSAPTAAGDVIDYQLDSPYSFEVEPTFFLSAASPDFYAHVVDEDPNAPAPVGLDLAAVAPPPESYKSRFVGGEEDLVAEVAASLEDEDDFEEDGDNARMSAYMAPPSGDIVTYDLAVASPSGGGVDTVTTAAATSFSPTLVSTMVGPPPVALLPPLPPSGADRAAAAAAGRRTVTYIAGETPQERKRRMAAERQRRRRQRRKEEEEAEERRLRQKAEQLSVPVEKLPLPAALAARERRRKLDRESHRRTRKSADPVTSPAVSSQQKVATRRSRPSQSIVSAIAHMPSELADVLADNATYTKYLAIVRQCVRPFALTLEGIRWPTSVDDISSNKSLRLLLSAALGVASRSIGDAEIGNRFIESAKLSLDEIMPPAAKELALAIVDRTSVRPEAKQVKAALCKEYMRHNKDGQGPKYCSGVLADGEAAAEDAAAAKAAAAGNEPATAFTGSVDEHWSRPETIVAMLLLAWNEIDNERTAKTYATYVQMVLDSSPALGRMPGIKASLAMIDVLCGDGVPESNQSKVRDMLDGQTATEAWSKRPDLVALGQLTVVSTLLFKTHIQDVPCQIFGELAVRLETQEAVFRGYPFAFYAIDPERKYDLVIEPVGNRIVCQGRVDRARAAINLCRETFLPAVAPMHRTGFAADLALWDALIDFRSLKVQSAAAKMRAYVDVLQRASAFSPPTFLYSTMRAIEICHALRLEDELERVRYTLSSFSQLWTSCKDLHDRAEAARDCLRAGRPCVESESRCYHLSGKSCPLITSLMNMCSSLRIVDMTSMADLAASSATECA